MSGFEDGFDPIETARTIERSYRGYISSTIHFARRDLQDQLESLIGEAGYLAKGPYLEAAPPYQGASTVRELVSSGGLCKSMLLLGDGNVRKFDPDRKLYLHQVRALQKARAGKNYIVTTGTGSGKTECFLLPILDDILREFEKAGPRPGVRALILYPMNALANDQLKRLRDLLAGTQITFGRYTGDTQDGQGDAEREWHKENPGMERLPNELISREVMRKTPPNILLSNYSMLEYLLLRPEDSSFFSGAFGGSWRHLAIDEAHMYSGSLGTEIAYLVRRLKARIGAGLDDAPHIQCYATSATMGSKDDLAKIAKFASDLFGEPFSTVGDVDVIVGTPDSPVDELLPVWGALPLSAWGSIMRALDSRGSEGEALDIILRDLLPSEQFGTYAQGDTPELGLGQVLLGEESASKLIRAMDAGLLDLTPRDDSSAITQLGIAGLDAATLSEMVEVLCSAQRPGGSPVLSSRYHSFLRGPEGLFINLHTGSLLKDKHVSEEVEGLDDLVPVYEIAACRHCGEAYLLGSEEPLTERGCSWLNPKPIGDNAVDAEHFDPRVYYRLLASEDEVLESETLLWICPTCGSLHDAGEEGGHVFDHPATRRMPIGRGNANEENSQCPHCGYNNRNAIQPMRVSPEAVGSVVCYDLVRAVPPFKTTETARRGNAASVFGKLRAEAAKGSPKAGSTICFSDRRQDAAYFAPAMERTYGDLTIRQIIREAVDECCDGRRGVEPSVVRDWIATEGARRYGLLFETSSNSALASSWVLGELMTDSPRNSLESLGAIRLEPSGFLERYEEVAPETVPEVLSLLSASVRSWLTVEDFLLFMRFGLESLRKSGALVIPPGVEKLLKKRTRVEPSYFCPRNDGKKDAGCISFIGRSTGTENSRSAFIRKTALAKYGIEVSREESTSILGAIFDYMTDFLSYLKEMGETYYEDKNGEMRLNMDLWRLYPCSDDDMVYRCDMCGQEYHWDCGPSCPTFRCEGRLHPMTFKEGREKDAYYKGAFMDGPVPIRIEEHTAQLSPERARSIQADFLEGKVNVLSCTTTFELGVDVGDLRCVFMRNVPPKAANYTQRAGRVGRRAGKPGYAVTFARLRPHDLSLFKTPERIIRGEMPAPCCYLDNEAIALRHVYAIVLSEYFRNYCRDFGDNEASRWYNAFLDMSEPNPEGMKRFRAFLEGHPIVVFCQLDAVFPKGSTMRDRLAIDEWGWVDRLVGDPEGRLVLTHESKYDDYSRIDEAASRYRANGEDAKAGSMLHVLGSLKKQRTIEVLAENGVLPKYGFPTDLVELHISETERAGRSQSLRLQRGLRQAIREYAPGSEVIADKLVWKSVGIRKPRGRSLEVRLYGKCPNCDAFIWPIDDYSSQVECKSCHEMVALQDKMLIPSAGFRAELVEGKDAGDLRPRAKGGVRIEFSQSWEGEVRSKEIEYPGGIIRTSYASNGKLCALNAGDGSGFLYCPYCGAAAQASSDSLKHEDWCIERKSKRYKSLGTSFTSDVLEFRFELRKVTRFEKEDWESLSWAFYAAASNLLEIPESEIGATFYRNDSGAYSIMLYDNVPGGAGHALQLAERDAEVVQAAYDIVSSCTCGEDTCCYGCLCNYFNQARQSHLSRGGVLRIMRSLGITAAE